jgi:hypothetical protein
MSGRGEDAENHLLDLLSEDEVDRFAKQDGYTFLMQHASSDSVRQEARQQLTPSFSRSFKLRRVAETFAWGVRIGRELTGKLFSIQMIAGEQLGYTRFTENKIYISPMPILRGEFHGREVVRALILHEYGHHMYHRGEDGLRVWEQSEREGLHRLLNLVSDEHLERNLRALDRRFGDQLKQLAAYAFQHTSREIAVDHLLNSLGIHAWAVLTSSRLGVARRWGCAICACPADGAGKSSQRPEG